mgnify:CR=1 FL=1
MKGKGKTKQGPPARTPAASDPNAQTAVASSQSTSVTDSTGREWLWYPWVTVPEGYIGFLYWYIFGRGGFQGFQYQTGPKLPGLTMVLLRSLLAKDFRLVTELLPTQTDPKKAASSTAPQNPTAIDVAALQDELTASRLIGGELSFDFKMTASLANCTNLDDEGEVLAVEDRLMRLVRAETVYSDIDSTQVADRLTDITSAQLRAVLKKMRYQEGYFVDPAVFLLGSIDEAAGILPPGTNSIPSVIDRYAWMVDPANTVYHITIPGSPIPKNLFSINLRDSREVAAAVDARSTSLLAQIRAFGYDVTFLGIKDVNTTPELEEALAAVVIAEARRSEDLVKTLAREVDTAIALAERSTRLATAASESIKIQATGIKSADAILGVLERHSTPQEVDALFKFLEQWRRRQSIAEADGSYTQIEIGGDASATGNLQPLIAAVIAAMDARDAAKAKNPEPPKPEPPNTTK